MLKLRAIAACTLSSVFLPACTTLSPGLKAPAPAPFTVEPHSEIRPAADANIDYYELGNYYTNAGKLELAVESYIKVLSADKKYLQARNALGQLYARQGRLTDAESVLRDIVVQNPGAAYLHNNLGYVYFLQGQYDAARGEFQRALDLQPNHEWARNNLRLMALAEQPRAVEKALNSQAAAKAVTVPFEVWDPVTKPSLENSATYIKPPPPPIVMTSNPVPKASSIDRVEISNGNGTTGLAKRFSVIFVHNGIKVDRITNQLPYKQLVTEIQYRDGFEQEAQDVKSALLGYAMAVRGNPLHDGINLRVVLGKDILPRMAEIDSNKPNVVALSKSIGVNTNDVGLR